MTMLHKLTVFEACPCELGQMVDYPQTFSSTGKYRHTLQARRYMRVSLSPENKKEDVSYL